MTVTIWHNPRCTKSRQTLQLLRDNGIEPQIIEYLKTPPSAKEIVRIAEMLGPSSSQLIRIGESIFGELGLDNTGSIPTLADTMHANPILIERPVVITDNAAAIGRPPENVLEILD